MNLQQLKGMIAAQAPACPEPECGEPYDQWPDADETEDKVMFIARDALFASSCSKGHVSEFYLPELKAGEVVAHTRTERTLGRNISQKDCDHAKNVFFAIPEDAETQTIDGPVTGPVDLAFCVFCGRKKVAIKKGKDETPERGKGRIIW